MAPKKKVAPNDTCEITLVNQEKVARLKAAMPDEDALGRLAESFKVLSDPGRIRIIHALSMDELCVCELAALLGMTTSAVSHQLRILRNLGLVRFRKEGRMAYYYLRDKELAGLVGKEMERQARQSRWLSGEMRG